VLALINTLAYATAVAIVSVKCFIEFVSAEYP
jgi:hypothetical protein